MKLNVVILLMGLLCLCGCKKRDDSPNATTRGNPPQHQPIDSVGINGQEIQFPKTRIALIDSEPVKIMLHSVGEGENTLRFTLEPPANSLKELDGVEFDIKAPEEAWVDSLEGIVLENGKWILQPWHVRTLSFCEENWVRIELVGDFLAFEEGSDVPKPEKVKVIGIWEGTLEVRD